MTNSQGQYVGRSIALTPEQDKVVKEMADAEGLSVSEMFRKWIECLQKTRVFARNDTVNNS